MNTRRRWIAAFSLLLAGTGLVLVVWFLRRPRGVVYDVQLSAAMRTLPQLRVAFNGRPVEQLAVETTEADPFHHIFLSVVSFETEGDAQTMPSVSAEMLSPCGWKSLNVDVQKWPREEEIEDAARRGQPVGVSGLLERSAWDVRSIEFWVDNRGGNAAQLSVGQAVLGIPADASGLWQFPAPDCEAGSMITLNSTHLGAVPKGQWWPPTETGMPFLIDTSGRRCYQSKEVFYGKEGGVTFSEPEIHYYSHRTLHRLDLYGPEFFLQRAPAKVPASAMLLPDLPEDSLDELIEVPCR